MTHLQGTTPSFAFRCVSTAAAGASADVERALLRHQKATGTSIDTIVVLNEDGLFGATGEPAARHQTVVPLLWLQVLDLLGRVPQGSTTRFLKDGILP
jgi:hypothetical protein